MLKKTAAPKDDGVKVTFALPLEETADRVSVVGDFNDWDPSAHPLRKRANGTRSVSVVLPPDTEARFRYLDSEGRWLNEPDADDERPNAHGGTDSVIILD
jgi:1,4-alpha-glucan branching enzyme